MLLEGLEVVFIVITFGDNQGNVGLAALGAAAAVLVIAAVGVAARAPLARVPENTMKFGGRHHAHLVRHLLGGRGRRGALAGQ